MGRTTLLLLTVAAAAAGAASAAAQPLPRGGAAPPPANTRAAARFSEMVDAGRKAQTSLSLELDGLQLLARSYEWERDAAKAEAKRVEVRARIAPLLESYTKGLEAIHASLRRFADEHGLETLERLTDSRTEGSPDIVAVMRAQTFHAQGLAFVSRVQSTMLLEEDAWRRFQLMESERRRFQRTLWGLALAFLVSLALVAYAVRIILRRRRPPTSGPPGPHRRGEIIDLRPE